VAEFRYSGTTTKIGYHKIPFCLGLWIILRLLIFMKVPQGMVCYKISQPLPTLDKSGIHFWSGSTHSADYFTRHSRVIWG
jgi:hypothetical protein